MIQPLCMINPQTVPVAFRVILRLLGSRNPSVDLPATVFGVNCEFMLFFWCSIILFNFQFLCSNVLCILFFEILFNFVRLYVITLVLVCYTQINQSLNNNINKLFIINIIINQIVNMFTMFFLIRLLNFDCSELNQSSEEKIWIENFFSTETNGFQSFNMRARQSYVIIFVFSFGFSLFSINQEVYNNNTTTRKNH